MTVNDIRNGPYTAHCACQMCCVSHVANPPPPLPWAAQNGRLWVTFFVTKYRDLFCDQGGGLGGGGSGLDPPPTISILGGDVYPF